MCGCLTSIYLSRNVSSICCWVVRSNRSTAFRKVFNLELSVRLTSFAEIASSTLFLNSAKEAFFCMIFFFCLSICQQDFAKTTRPIFTNPGGGMCLGPKKSPLHFGAELLNIPNTESCTFSLGRRRRYPGAPIVFNNSCVVMWGFKSKVSMIHWTTKQSWKSCLTRNYVMMEYGGLTGDTTKHQTSEHNNMNWCCTSFRSSQHGAHFSHATALPSFPKC